MPRTSGPSTGVVSCSVATCRSTGRGRFPRRLATARCLRLPLCSGTRLAHRLCSDLALCSAVNADHITENKRIHFKAVYCRVAGRFVAEGQPSMRVRRFWSHKQIPLSHRIRRVLSSVAVGHPEGTRSALDRFRGTSIIPRWWLGSALLPKPRRCQDLSLSRMKPRPSIAWCSWLLAVRALASSRGRCGGYLVRTCPRARTWRRPHRSSRPMKRALSHSPLANRAGHGNRITSRRQVSDS